MTWVFFLSIAVLIAVAAWFTQIKPAGTRKIKGTGLMKVARVVLYALVLTLLLLAVVSYSQAQVGETSHGADRPFLPHPNGRP